MKRFPLPYVSPTPLNTSFSAKIKHSSRKSKCKILRHYNFYSTNAHLLPKLFFLLPKLIYESSLPRTLFSLKHTELPAKEGKDDSKPPLKGVKTSYEDFLVTPLNFLCKGAISSTMIFVVKIWGEIFPWGLCAVF